MGGESAVPHRVVRGSVAARLPQSVLAGAPTFVAGADGRGAQHVQLARLGANAGEVVAAVGDRVVRVDAVEAPGRSKAGQAGLREVAHRRGEARAPLHPLRGGQVLRLVDEDVADPERAQVREVARQRVAAAGIRLDLGADAEVVPPRLAQDERQADVGRRAAAPPGRDDLVDPSGADLRHLRGDDVGARARVRASRGVERRVEIARRSVSVLSPVLPRAVDERRPIPGVVEDCDERPRCRRRRRQHQGGDHEEQEAAHDPPIL